MTDIVELFRQEFFYFSLLQIISFLTVGIPLGHLLVHKNLGLFSDSLSHSLIPGLAVSVYWFGLKSNSLTFGALVWGILVSLIFSLLGGISSKKRDSILIAISLLGISLGLMLNQLLKLNLDLTHLLFGSPLLTEASDLIRSAIVNGTILLVLAFNWKRLELFCVDADFARLKYGEFKMNFIFTFITSALVISGFEIFGVLLTTGLLILPALLFQKSGYTVVKQSLISLAFTAVIVLLAFVISAQANLTFSSVLITALSGLTLIRFAYLSIAK
jgi:ABC-type Mn2+/Zn2+ transport system permease subunit